MAQINQLFKPLAKTGSMTMVSRVLGFMRDVFLSALLGASPVMDAFLIAFRFPNIFRSLFAEGAFSAAFVPLFVSLKKKSKKNETTAITFAAGVGIKFFLLLLVFTLLVILFMPEIMWGVAPGFRDNPSSMAMVVAFGRISFPYLLAMSSAALFAGIMQSHGFFLRGSVAASFLNICLIIVAVAIILVRGSYDDNNMMTDIVAGKILCMAVIIAGLWQAWYMWRGVRDLYPNYFHNNIKKIWRQSQQQIVKRKFPPEEKRLLKTMTPSMIGSGGQQLNALVSDMIATTIGVGAVTHLFYADRLVQLPLGVVGIALGLVLLQRFSYAQDGKEKKQLQPLLQQGLCIGLAFAIPCMLALHFLSIYFISFMFERGAFDAVASQRTAAALTIFALALPFYILNKVFQPFFYAKGDTKTPVRITLMSFVINGTVAYFLTRNMGMAEKGIATASVMAAGFTSFVFFFILFHKGILPWRWHFWRPVLLLLMVNIPLFVFYNSLPEWLIVMGGVMDGGWGDVWGKNWLLVATAMVGSAIYYLPILWFCRSHLSLTKAGQK